MLHLVRDRVPALTVTFTPCQTIFYPSSKSSDAIVAPLTRGTVLLHRYVLLVSSSKLPHLLNPFRHGHECLLHEGSEVRRGTKYVLRSDVMFMN